MAQSNGRLLTRSQGLQDGFKLRQDGFEVLDDFLGQGVGGGFVTGQASLSHANLDQPYRSRFQVAFYVK